MGSLFVRPPADAYADVHDTYLGKWRTYAEYNYLRPGLIPKLKAKRFETALQLAKLWMGRGESAIDLGCADGIFLPSLSAHFQHVTAVDTVPKYLGWAQALVSRLKLQNVELICNDSMSFEQLRVALGARTYSVAFVLETLEHVGQLPNLYESKGDFLQGVLSLLKPGGVAIISVPKMVGPAFFIKHMIQRMLRLPRDKMTFGQAVRSAFLYDTDALEPFWDGHHVGFNHIKLENMLEKRFDIVRTQPTLTSLFYVVRQRIGT